MMYNNNNKNIYVSRGSYEIVGGIIQNILTQCIELLYAISMYSVKPIKLIHSHSPVYLDVIKGFIVINRNNYLPSVGFNFYSCWTHVLCMVLFNYYKRFSFAAALFPIPMLQSLCSRFSVANIPMYVNAINILAFCVQCPLGWFSQQTSHTHFLPSWISSPAYPYFLYQVYNRALRVTI